jgi:hypothetical protein
MDVTDVEKLINGVQLVIELIGLIGLELDTQMVTR